MAQLRSVNTKFWDDTWVEELKPNEKLLFLYLITNKYANLLGVYSISEKRICFETGLDKASVSNGLKAFESVRKVIKLPNDYLYLPKWLKNQKLNTNMKVGVFKLFNEFPNDVKIGILGNDYLTLSKDYQTLSNTMLKYEVEDEREIEDEKEDEDLGGKPPHSPKKSNEELLLERENKFKVEVLSHNGYDVEMLNAFFNYWSEPNKSKSKMLWETKPTFDVKRRLITWAGKSFNNTSNGQNSGNRSDKEDNGKGVEHKKPDYTSTFR